MSKAQTEWMLNQLGCTLDESTFTEIFDEVDSDSDGHLILGEFITAIGMLKQNMLEVLDLEQSFTRLRDDARLAARASLAEAPPGSTPATSPLANQMRARSRAGCARRRARRRRRRGRRCWSTASTRRTSSRRSTSRRRRRRR